MIEGKDFIDYFLMVGDMVRWAKDHNIPVGPARGSAAASLLCYMLRITEVNPMDFPDLVFERFIDVSRADLPDIDLDFASAHRQKLYEYAAEKYGAECVANVGTFTMYRSKNSLDDVARVFKIPTWEVDKVKDVLIERSSGDLRASATIEDTMEQFEQAAAVFKEFPDLAWALELEGNVKGDGVHAAGIVVANGPLSRVTSVTRKEVAGQLRDVIVLDKEDAERQGLLKMDFLALVTMDLIDGCLQETGMTLEELYKLPLDDEATIEAFRQNDVVGIFQFEGRAMRSICGALKPDTFKEICDIGALARPGPLHSGSTSNYLDVKRGRAKVQPVHPLVDHIVESTHYQIIYQEQILKIVAEVGNFDWTSASYIRKIISKKLGEQEFNRQWDKFRTGSMDNGLSEDLAKQVWMSCITAGAYAFNYAHCCSYGMISYWAMWFKVHHPAVFFTHALRWAAKNKDKRTALLRDTKRFGRDLETLPPDLNLSSESWTVEGDALRMGFTQIEGIAEKTAAQIMLWREGKEGPLRWSQLGEVKGIGAKTIEKIDEFVMSLDPLGVFKLRRDIEKIKLWLPEVGLPQPTHTASEIPYERMEGSRQSLLAVWIGTIQERNLRDMFESHMARTGEALDPTSIRDPELREWVVMTGQDEDEYISIHIDRWMYNDQEMKDKIWGIRPGQDLVLVKGVKRWFQTARKLYVREMWVIDPDD